LTLRLPLAETITNRAAFVARGRRGDPFPRIVIDIPLRVR
jgi:hypothetical protein